MKPTPLARCLLALVCGLGAGAAPAGELTVVVQRPAATTLPADQAAEFRQLIAPGLASGALGAAAPPMFASGLVVGGLLIVPGAIILSDVEHGRWQRIVDALGAIDLEREADQAIRRELDALPGDPPANLQLTLRFTAYGVLALDKLRGCVIAAADLDIVRPGRVPLRHPLTIVPGGRSADAPPPQCATLERLAEHDGELVRDTTAEYVRILARMTAARVAATEAR